MVGGFLLNQMNRILTVGRPGGSPIKGDLISEVGHSLKTGLLLPKWIIAKSELLSRPIKEGVKIKT